MSNKRKQHYEREEKLHRAIVLTGVAPYPRTVRSISKVLPDKLVDELTEPQLGMVVTLLHRHWNRAVQQTLANVILDGQVWDAEHKVMRQIEPVSVEVTV